MAFLNLLPFFHQRYGLRGMFPRGNLSDRGLQVAQHLGHVGVVFPMKGIEFIEDIVPSLSTRMAKHLSAGHHLEGDATEPHADLDMAVTRILPLTGPVLNQHLKVMMVHDQVVGDAEDGGPQGTVAETDQGAVGFVYLITLVSRGSQPGPACQTFGIGIVLDGTRFARKLGGADDIDPWPGQQQEVGRLDQAMGQVSLQGLNLPGFLLAILVQGLDNAQVLVRGDVAGRGLLGPIHDFLEGALLKPDVGGVEGVIEGSHARVA